MVTSRLWLEKIGNAALAFGNIRAIALSTTDPITATTDPAVILAAEVEQVTGGYQSQAFTQTEVTWNSSLGYPIADQAIVFSEAADNPGWQYNYIGLWQGRGANSSKVCTVDPDTDRVTVTGHLCVNGDLGFVIGAVQPGGLPIGRRFVKSIDSNTLEFYTDSDLTELVDITSTGSGTLRFVYANGQLIDGVDLPITTVTPGQSRTSLIRYRSMG